MPRAWPWRASQSTVATCRARSFPRLDCPPGRQFSPSGRAEQSARPAGPLSQGALSQGILFDQLLWTLAAIAGERPCSCSWTICTGWTTPARPFSCTWAVSSAAAGLLVLGAYRPRPSGWAGATPLRRDVPPPPGGRHRRAAPAEGRDRGRTGSGGRPRLCRSLRGYRAQPPGRALSGCALRTDGRACALHRGVAAQPPGARGAPQGRGGPLGGA